MRAVACSRSHTRPNSSRRLLPAGVVWQLTWLLVLLSSTVGCAAASEPVALGADVEQRTGTPVSLHLDQERLTSKPERKGVMTVHGTIKLGRVELAPNIFIAGVSGLAFSADSGILYAVTDFGVLWRWRPVFAGGQLFAVDVLGATALQNRQGRPLNVYYADAEGLDILDGRNGDPNDDRLIVSFERRPRLTLFSTDGRELSHLYLPPRLARLGNFADKNKALEAVTVLPGEPSAGLRFLTAPEAPLRDAAGGLLTLHAGSNGRDGEDATWPYRTSRGPNMGIVAIEALADGSVIILERGFSALPPRLDMRLRRLASLPTAENYDGRPLEPATLVETSTLSGHRIDNFEGLAHHEGNRFFIVSDDNDTFLQRTLLSWIELD